MLHFHNISLQSLTSTAHHFNRYHYITSTIHQLNHPLQQQIMSIITSTWTIITSYHFNQCITSTIITSATSRQQYITSMVFGKRSGSDIIQLILILTLGILKREDPNEHSSHSKIMLMITMNAMYTHTHNTTIGQQSEIVVTILEQQPSSPSSILIYTVSINHH